MKKTAFIFALWLFNAICFAQESASVFNFLKLPASAHITALGGKSISLIEDDASFIFQNPALASSVSDKTLNLNFLTFMQGSKNGSAAFVKTAGEASTWGIGAQFASYGSLKETTPSGEVVGEFSAIDLALSGTYSYLLSERWAGGVTAKMIYSGYGDYTALALAVDLGLNYYNPDNEFSCSFVAAHAGGQVKSFADTRERLPFDLVAGFSKKMLHAPIRITVTMNDLTRWNNKYYFNPEGKSKFGTILMNHFSLGVDLLASDNIYLSAGYNFRRANEMAIAGKSHGAGLSAGAGLILSRFKLSLAYAQYHVSTPSFSISLNYSLYNK